MSRTILTIGEILVEVVAEDRGEGFLAPIALTGPYPSGAPAIFIDQVARFGQPAAMIGCVGDDDFGTVNLDRLRRDGVDVSGIAIDPELPTGSAFVRYRPDGSRRFVYNIKHSASGRTRLDASARRLVIWRLPASRLCWSGTPRPAARGRFEGIPTSERFRRRAAVRDGPGQT